MKTFEEYMRNLNESSSSQELWSANKGEIMNWWSRLKPNQPIMPNPIPHDKEGSTYGFDGIRVTGSKQFVTSVLSRFKDFVYQENPHTSLKVVFRQIEDKYTHTPENNSFVFYANVAKKAPKKVSKSKNPQVKNPFKI